jgi:hypothetical protein
MEEAQVYLRQMVLTQHLALLLLLVVEVEFLSVPLRLKTEQMEAPVVEAMAEH